MKIVDLGFNEQKGAGFNGNDQDLAFDADSRRCYRRTFLSTGTPHFIPPADSSLHRRLVIGSSLVIAP